MGLADMFANRLYSILIAYHRVMPVPGHSLSLWIRPKLPTTMISSASQWVGHD